MIIAGDFNCALSPADCTRKTTLSRALATLVNGMGLRDMWGRHNHCPAYTYYNNDGALRIARIFATKTLIQRKQGAEKFAAAFSDHFAVIVRITFDTRRRMSKASVRRMNIALLEEKL